MIKTITKLGNSPGIILDAALLELARLKVGDQINVEIHSGGTISLTPINPLPPRKAVSTAIEGTLKRYARTMKRLA